jgi:hypothetical protein
MQESRFKTLFDTVILKTRKITLNLLFATCLSLLFNPVNTFSQSKFHLNTGFLLTQVDGDNYGGFKKMGYSFGAGFCFENGTELQFIDWSTRINQKGFREVNVSNWDLARLTYLETDLLYGFVLGEKSALCGGLYYGRLLNYYPRLKKSDLAPVLRFDYRFTERISLQSRFSMSVISIRLPQYSTWLNRCLQFEFVCRI